MYVYVCNYCITPLIFGPLGRCCQVGCEFWGWIQPDELLGSSNGQVLALNWWLWIWISTWGWAKLSLLAWIKSKQLIFDVEFTLTCAKHSNLFHEPLLNKLYSMQLNPYILIWLFNYLCNRQQHASDFWGATRLCYRATPFLIYINNITTCPS